MKFNSVILAVVSATSLLSKVVAAADASFTPTEQKPYNFKIEYNVIDRQESISDIVKLVNGDTLSLNYTFYNGEDEEVSVIGVGGSFSDPRTGITRTNITANSLGPVQIASGESAQFIQHVGVDVTPDDYLVVPGIYAVYNSSMILLGSRSQLVSIADAPISFFNPQLLFLELVLLATVGGAAYFAYEMFGKQYLRSNQPIKVATVKRAVPGKKSGSPTPGATASGYDETWLPKNHLKTTKKAKKA